jgi:hypothetical protein
MEGFKERPTANVPIADLVQFLRDETLEIKARHKMGKWQLPEYAGFHKAKVLARIAVHVGPLFDLSASAPRLD